MGSGVCCVSPPCNQTHIHKDVALSEQFHPEPPHSSRVCLSERLLKVKIKTINRTKNSTSNCGQCLKLIHKNQINETNKTRCLHKRIRNNITNSKSTSNLMNTVGKCSEFLLTFDCDSPHNANNDKMDIIAKELPKDECERLIQLFMNNFLLEGLSIDEITLIIQNLVEVDLNDGMEIYDEEFEGNFFFIIAKGEVNLIENGNVVRTYKQWEYFGDLSLLSKVVRIKSAQSTSAICVGNVILYILDNMTVHYIQNELIHMRYEEQYNFVKKIPIFRNLDAISKYTLAEKILIKEYDKGNIIINEKAKNIESYLKYHSHTNFGRVNNTANNIKISTLPGTPESNSPLLPSQFTNDLLFLIKNGTISLEKQGKSIQTLSENDYFGVSNILFDNPPTKKDKLSAIASSPVTLYEISKAGLIEALGFNYKETILFSLFKSIIHSNKYFSSIFHEGSLLKLFKTFRLVRYNNHEAIYIEGKSSVRVIVVIDGCVMNAKTKKVVAHTGDVIGEKCFQNKKIVLCSGLIAFPSLITLESEISGLLSILNLDVESLQQLKRLKRVNQLKRISLFKYMQRDVIDKMVESLSVEKFKMNEVIVNENEKGGNCYFIIKGCVQIFEKGRFIREIEKGNFFGERALIDHNDIRTATVIAKSSKVVCFILSKSNFNLIFNNENSRKYIENQISIQNSNISLSHLYFIKQIGKGKYGNVFLVHDTKNIYALKVISIKQAIKNKIGSYLLSEKNIMKCMDHPFIMKSVTTLKDEHFIYFILEHINGESFEEYLNNRCMFKQVNELKFYSACLLIILEYLNAKNIVHRDIKPSNIMLDRKAYPHLIDFGAAKIVDNYTTTVIGTPEYTAPEIISGKGYSLSCDFWSVGIIAYEIYYGKCPFGGGDVIAIYKNIINQDIKYGNSAMTKNVDEFISCLLQRKVNQRICKVNELKEKELFSMNADNENVKTYKKDYFDMVMDMEVKAPATVKEGALLRNCIEVNKELMSDYLKNMFSEEMCDVDINKEEYGEEYTKWLNEF